MSKHVYILDPGHGGLDPRTGQYVTSGKRSPKWPDGTIYYEGVGNREIAKMIADKLKALGIEYAYTVEPTDHTDLSLTNRCNIANKLHKDAKNRAILISIHSNGHTNESANGFEVFTSPGVTKSDSYATIWYEEMGKEFKELKGRSDMRDGDPDKEENFTMVKATNCPAILLETMFHTNKKECDILMSKEGKERIANVVIRTIQRIEKL